jgi:hypothetical protein
MGTKPNSFSFEFHYFRLIAQNHALVYLHRIEKRRNSCRKQLTAGHAMINVFLMQDHPVDAANGVVALSADCPLSKKI